MNNVKGKTGQPAQRWAQLAPLVIGMMLVILIIVFVSWGAHSLGDELAQIKALVQQGQQSICGA